MHNKERETETNKEERKTKGKKNPQKLYTTIKVLETQILNSPKDQEK